MNHFHLRVFQLSGRGATAVHADTTTKTFGAQNGRSVYPQITVTIDTKHFSGSKVHVTADE